MDGSMELNTKDMQKLVELLKPPPPPEVLQGDDLPKTGYDITSSRNKMANKAELPLGPTTIEEFEEREAKDLDELIGIDNREEPPYSMHYQQDVSAEDVYLQMSAKTPGSASCERMILRISMSGDKRENIDLTVERTLITVDSSRYKLRLPLPHAVDPDNSKASWDPAEQTLVLSLKLDREFDYINF